MHHTCVLATPLPSSNCELRRSPAGPRWDQVLAPVVTVWRSRLSSYRVHSTWTTQIHRLPPRQERGHWPFLPFCPHHLASIKCDRAGACIWLAPLPLLESHHSLIWNSTRGVSISKSSICLHNCSCIIACLVSCMTSPLPLCRGATDNVMFPSLRGLAPCFVGCVLSLVMYLLLATSHFTLRCPHSCALHLDIQTLKVSPTLPSALASKKLKWACAPSVS